MRAHARACARTRARAHARHIYGLARDFDACVWARGDGGRSHGIQPEKLARVAWVASLDAPRALRTPKNIKKDPNIAQNAPLILDYLGVSGSIWEHLGHLEHLGTSGS